MIMPSLTMIMLSLSTIIRSAGNQETGRLIGKESSISANRVLVPELTEELQIFKRRVETMLFLGSLDIITNRMCSIPWK